MFAVSFRLICIPAPKRLPPPLPLAAAEWLLQDLLIKHLVVFHFFTSFPNQWLFLMTKVRPGHRKTWWQRLRGCCRAQATLCKSPFSRPAHIIASLSANILMAYINMCRDGSIKVTRTYSQTGATATPLYCDSLRHSWGVLRRVSLTWRAGVCSEGSGPGSSGENIRPYQSISNQWVNNVHVQSALQPTGTTNKVKVEEKKNELADAVMSWFGK